MYDYKMSNPKCTAQRMCKVTKSSPKFQIYFKGGGGCRVNWQVQNYKIFLKNSTFGVEKSNFLRGRSLMAYWA